MMIRPLLLAWLPCSLACANPPAGGTEFQQLVDSFGTLQTLAGRGQMDVLDNNDWQPAFEGAQAINVELSNPHMAAADVFGNIFVADKSSHSILKILPDGTLHTVAGTHTAGFNGDGPASATTLQISDPNGLFCLPDGTLYIYDASNRRIRRLDTAGQMTTVINDSDPFYSFIGRGLWVSADESLVYYTDGTVIKSWSPGGSPTVVASGFLQLGNIAMHPVSGLLYVTDRATSNPNQRSKPTARRRGSPATVRPPAGGTGLLR
jgi:sugar lactone lactonase YvrE